MSNQFTFNESQLLERIIEYRRSIRQFRTDLPSKEMITSIINAGLWAPYSGLAVNGSEDFRKFYVITSEKRLILERINGIIKDLSKELLIQFEKAMEENTFVKEHGEPFHEYGKHAFNACIIGFALNDISIGKRPKIEDVIKWL